MPEMFSPICLYHSPIITICNAAAAMWFSNWKFSVKPLFWNFIARRFILKYRISSIFMEGTTEVEYQSINQSNQSSDQSNDQSINQSINRAINRSIKRSINRAIKRSINQSIDQSVVDRTVKLLAIFIIRAQFNWLTPSIGEEKVQRPVYSCISLPKREAKKKRNNESISGPLTETLLLTFSLSLTRPPPHRHSWKNVDHWPPLAQSLSHFHHFFRQPWRTQHSYYTTTFFRIP